VHLCNTVDDYINWKRVHEHRRETVKVAIRKYEDFSFGIKKRGGTKNGHFEQVSSSRTGRSREVTLRDPP
jgi:hypothetical protein